MHLVLDHKWAVLAAIVIGFIVRALKDDTKLPTIPKRLRPWLSVALGVLAGTIEKLATGVTWENAIIDALIAGLLPMAGNDVVKSAIGRDVPLPGLTPSNDDDKMDPPTGGATPLIVFAWPMGCLFACAMLFVDASCGGGFQDPKTPRETARSIVLLVADGVKQADTSCAKLARDTQSVETAKTCAEAYNVARPSLQSAEQTIDAWNEGANHQVVCSVYAAMRALASMRDAIIAAGGKLPGAVVDALELGQSLTKECT